MPDAPYTFTTDTLVSMIEELAERTHDGHVTIFRFTSGWKCILGTPWIDMGEARNEGQQFAVEFMRKLHFGFEGHMAKHAPSKEPLLAMTDDAAGGEHAFISSIRTCDSLADAIENCIDRSEAENAAESPIETKLAVAILKHDWGTGLRSQWRIGPYRVDLALVDRRIAIECDGHDFHKTKQQRSHDAKRDRFLSAQGWTVLRCTGSEIHSDIGKVVADIQAVAQTTERV